MQTSMAAAILLLLTGAAQRLDPEAENEITVVGLSQPRRVKIDHLLDGVAAWRKERTALAPDSRLLFRVEGTATDGLQLVLRSRDGAIPLAVDGDGLFELPAIDRSAHYQLVTNRARGSLSIRPLVLSPGTSETDRRLGDLRLECRVGWAVIQHETSILIRGLFDAAGPCTSRRIGVYFSTRRAIATAEVAADAGALPVPVLPNRINYRPPIADPQFDNEARIRLRWR